MIGETTGLTELVPDLGCNQSDYDSFTPGNIAIVSRGICTFTEKSVIAGIAGATGMIVYNNVPDPDEPFFPSVVSYDTIPAASIARNAGLELVGSIVHLRVLSQVWEEVSTYNIIAETPFGDPNQVVMAGCHIDSVAWGPGINDNGSGAAAVLELALQLIDKKSKIQNKVRFGFWGAEEIGLFGSKYYLFNLNATEEQEAINDIALYLNLDMIGSPNAALELYAFLADNEAGMEVEAGARGSFLEYFDYKGIPTKVNEDDAGRSDHSSFAEVGIPISG